MPLESMLAASSIFLPPSLSNIAINPNQLLIIRRRRQAYRFVLLQILLVVIAIIVNQAILSLIVSRKLFYVVSHYNRSYILDLLNVSNNYNSRIFRTLRITRFTF